MKWNILVELERRKHSRRQVKDTAARGLGLISVLLMLYLGFAESVGQSERWQQVDKVMHCKRLINPIGQNAHDG